MSETPWPPLADRQRGDGETTYCDKAWHVGGPSVPAVRVLRCAWCGKTWARCAQCQRTSKAETAMRAHIARCHSGSRLPAHRRPEREQHRTWGDACPRCGGATEAGYTRTAIVESCTRDDCGWSRKMPKNDD